ncbi:hypothetical protein T265_05741 [Opisthorchis viverrini]|uniref:Uncharacterized protein n=1 Tax=Opisthorchis viverrini TaxID=6198 RepID=A0A074ZV22_OPIVI|nr:hypothetical protein T265_05741 [Opisthorchis viverrini]KER27210.1 hypothetical protein T265_05741 [Opisthorchis viverrini]
MGKEVSCAHPHTDTHSNTQVSDRMASAASNQAVVGHWISLPCIGEAPLTASHVEPDPAVTITSRGAFRSAGAVLQPLGFGKRGQIVGVKRETGESPGECLKHTVADGAPSAASNMLAGWMWTERMWNAAERAQESSGTKYGEATARSWGKAGGVAPSTLVSSEMD